MITALVWNARGVGNRGTVRRLKKLVRLYSLSFVVVIEPFLDATRADSLRQNLGFDACLVSSSNKIWCFFRNGISGLLIEETNQLYHLRLTHNQ